MKMKIRTIVALIAAAAVILIIIGAVACATSLPESPDNENVVEANGDDVVVLVHGMGRTKWSMTTLEWTLERQGYEVVNWGYSSVCCTVDELGEKLAADLEEVRDTNPDSIHFVGHSLGNIVIRAMLDHAPPEQSGHVVMLAPPNRGSESADRYADHIEWLLEPIDELTTRDNSTVNRLSTIEEKSVGIIAGEFDGKVTVEETRLTGADAHKTVPSNHTFIMNRSDVHHLVVDFLAAGNF